MEAIFWAVDPWGGAGQEVGLDGAEQLEKKKTFKLDSQQK